MMANGAVLAPKAHCRYTRGRNADTRTELRFAEGMSRGSSHSDWYGPLFRTFATRVRAGDRSQAALEEAVYVTRLIALAYESSREGRCLPFAQTPAEPAKALESTGVVRETPGPEAAAPPNGHAERRRAAKPTPAAVSGTSHRRGRRRPRAHSRRP